MIAGALSQLKRSSLHLCKLLGGYSLLENSRWRQQRLLILCYHATSLEREHEWRPALYMSPGRLERTLELLRRRRCTVLPLGEAVARMRDGDLPPRSVALTFDDGDHGFYRHAHPLLRRYGYPATVYLRTDYSQHPAPIFHLMCSYLLWKRGGRVVPVGGLLGGSDELDLRDAAGRAAALERVTRFADQRSLSLLERDALARELAARLGEDAEALWSRRVLQLMNAAEVAELAGQGVDFELHTHTHQCPNDAVLFRGEIQQNRARIVEYTEREPRHFCYPSGDCEPQFLPWLSDLGVLTATTCDVGYASRESDPLLLPRFVATESTPDLLLEGWLAGPAGLVPRHSRHSRRSRLAAGA